MRAKSILCLTMLILTAIVVLCIARIEYLNAAGGHVLPRDQLKVILDSWEVAESDLLEFMDNQFHRRRLMAARVDAYEKGESEPASVAKGAPYSKSEQRSIDMAMLQKDVLKKLRWCIQYLGWPQYFIAPFALFLCAICALGWKGWPIKAVSAGCASLCCLGIVLILMRGYWEALS